MPLRLAVRVLALGLATLSTFGCGDTPVEPELPVGIPPGWQGTIGESRFYEIGLYSDRHSGHAAAYIDGPPLFTSEVGLIQQLIRADDYRGKRVRLSAWVKTRGVVGPIAGIWMRVDGPGVVTGYDNMGNRALTGTTDWREVVVVLDVPSDALGIVIGAMLHGGGSTGAGTLFIDDMKFEIVGNDVDSTNMYDAPKPNTIDPAVTVALYSQAPKTPMNLDFEQRP